jgi:HEAT repeat protein
MKTQKHNLIPPRRITTRATLLLAVVLCGLAAQALGADETKNAYEYLSKNLVDKKNSDMVVAAFHAADDKEFLPLFVALARCGDKRKRLMATTALGQLGGPEAIAALKRQLAEDSAMGIRTRALVHLLDLDAADASVLSNATKIKDEGIQCMAARSLAIKSKNPQHRALAKATLTKVAGSSEAMIAAMANMGLLSMGDSSKLPGLTKLVSDPNTPTSTVRLIMLQIADEKIPAAEPLARIVISAPKSPVQTRIYACQALAAAFAKPVPMIFAAIRESNSMVFRIPAMGILAEQAGSKPYIGAIAKSALPIAPMASFEMARKTPGPTSSAAVQKALAIKHPVAINYIMQQAREDVDKLGAKADFYVAPLLEYIASVEPDTDRMAHEHIMAAQATTLLMDIGTPEAIAGLSKIFDGRYSAITRSAAAGLLRTKNKAARPIALKLLKNPYPELSTYGALTLGHLADPAASEHFNRIISRESGHSVAETTLASWYLLKVNKQSADAAKKLAKLIK